MNALMESMSLYVLDFHLEEEFRVTRRRPHLLHVLWLAIGVWWQHVEEPFSPLQSI